MLCCWYYYKKSKLHVNVDRVHIISSPLMSFHVITFTLTDHSNSASLHRNDSLSAPLHWYLSRLTNRKSKPNHQNSKKLPNRNQPKSENHKREKSKRTNITHKKKHSFKKRKKHRRKKRADRHLRWILHQQAWGTHSMASTLLSTQMQK